MTHREKGQTMIDLHLHSDASDGTLKPAEVLRAAKEKGLYAFALTDHDTVAGIPPFLHSGELTGIHFMPGIELSCEAEKHEIHILGYHIDICNQNLLNTLEGLRRGRRQRNLSMIEKFREDGIPMTLEKLLHGNEQTVITRAHFARVLIEEGYCANKEQAFKKYVGDGCRYYIPKPYFAPADAVRLIKDAGGTAVLAHPFQYHLSNAELEELIRELISFGLGGIEVYHSSHHHGQTVKLRQWCRKYGMLATGGSDFHGSNKPDIEIGTGRGSLKVPDHLYDELKNLL